MPDYVLEHKEEGRVLISTDEPLSEEDLAGMQDEFAKGRSVEQISKKSNIDIREAETHTPATAELVTITRAEYEALLALKDKGEG